MIRILGNRIWLLIFLGLQLCAGTLEVRLSDREIIAGESVFLTIAIVEEQNSTSLPPIDEISGVRVDHILNNAILKEILIDGHRYKYYIKTMTLEFRPEKSITIPAFHFIIDGKEKHSQKQELSVVRKKSHSLKKEKNFTINMELNRSSIYKDESVFLTILFKHKKNIGLMKMEYSKPDFSDFFVQEMIKEKVYEEKKSRVYKVVYLLTPKSIGNLLIPSSSVKLAIINRQAQEGGWYRDILDWHRVVSRPLYLSVEAIKEPYDIVGSFGLQESIDNVIIEENEPITLTIKIAGEGNLAFYRGVTFEPISNVTIYSDDADRNSSFQKGRLKSYYQKNFVFMGSDDFVIPSKVIKVFNPKSKKITILKTKSHQIKLFTHHQKSEKYWKKEGYIFLILAFLIGLITALLIPYLFRLYLKKKQKKSGFDGHLALQILYPHCSKDAEVEAMVHKLYAIKNGKKGIKIEKKILNKMLEVYQEKG